ncbi:MAG: hypothetical protein EOP88_16145 [Verrucomicrobiaceae bacterium]|nr:MAG: hypothetical protein EOP88_16145 [Verrucomicrobiaceae bacterium]
MSAFTEFVLVAIALYLWESTLWLPLRGVVLRRRWRGKSWKILDPRSYMAGKDLGVVPMLPFPTDSRIAPCQAPPLVATADGGFLMEIASGPLVLIKSLEWNDLSEKDHYLTASGIRTRTTSPRQVDLLRRSKNRGFGVETAVTRAWRLALSPARAEREWRKWKMVAGPLSLYGPVLALGFFGGLPLAYIHLGIMPMLILLVWLWLLMVWTAAHLWWLGKRAYPAARGSLKMDALLSLFVPFHAMRAYEIASVHAMATTHPVGLILSTGDTENPWLGTFVRHILHPLPGSPENAAFARAVKPLLSAALATRGKQLSDYDTVPDNTEDPETTGYCPRCQARYLPDVTVCSDCKDMPLSPFSLSASASNDPR